MLVGRNQTRRTKSGKIINSTHIIGGQNETARNRAHYNPSSSSPLPPPIRSPPPVPRDFHSFIIFPHRRRSLTSFSRACFVCFYLKIFPLRVKSERKPWAGSQPVFPFRCLGPILNPLVTFRCFVSCVCLCVAVRPPHTTPLPGQPSPRIIILISKPFQT